MEIKFLKKKKVFKKVDRDINPDFYWKSILGVTFFIIIASLIFGFLLFTKTNKDLVLPVINTNEQEIVKKERIEKVLQYFKESEKKSNNILNSPSPLVDPSL